MLRAGGRPKGEIDRYGREIPDGEYGTKDFERLVALKARTEAIARNLTDFHEENRSLRQDHRLLRRPGTRRGDAEGAQQLQCGPREGASRLRGARGLRRGRDRARVPRPLHGLETLVPTIVTTSQMLTTGVDVPDLQEHRPRAGHQLDDGIQADHRPRHARARRLRQAVLQHPRLHGQRDAAVCRSRLRRRAGAHHRRRDG